MDPYVGQIAFVDSQIARLLEVLERQRVLDTTIVIVVADHGESLGDHGERDHGIFLYDSVMRVPLIIKAPGMAPRRVSEVVRLTDLMPTVLDMLGIAAPPVDGVSLAGLLAGDERRLDLESYSESTYPQRFGWSPLRALRSGRFKFIEAPRPELYDLESDPFEQRNVHGERPAVAAAMARRLAVLSVSGEKTGAVDGAAVLPEVHERLAALGYVGTGPLMAGSDPSRYPDPKDCLPAYEARRDATASSVRAPASCR